MIEEPKLEVTVDKLGHETYRMSHNGILLDKEQAEYVAEKIKRLKQENDKLREIAKDMWRLLLVTGNDDLVLSIEVSGVVKEVIDAEELAKAMRELGVEVGK